MVEQTRIDGVVTARAAWLFATQNASRAPPSASVRAKEVAETVLRHGELLIDTWRQARGMWTFGTSPGTSRAAVGGNLRSQLAKVETLEQLGLLAN